VIRSIKGDLWMHMDRPVFVFGSNIAGRHDQGAALEALRSRGAIYGNGFGPQGNSYAIPTKDEYLRLLPLEKIAAGIDSFLDFARTHPWSLFEVTPIACDYPGYNPERIAPLFNCVPHNVTLPQVFKDVVHAPA
jgi:hypothetical protein